MTDKLDSLFKFVTRHNLAVVILLLVVTAGVAAGIPQMNLGGSGGGGDIAGDTQTVQKSEYVQDAYVNETRTESNTTVAVVYVRDEDGNALSKSALVASLEYQQTVLNNSTVAGSLSGGASGVANVIGTRAAGSPDATVTEQLAALRAASPNKVRRLVGETLTSDSAALQLLPTGYEPGTAQAESHRMVIRLEGNKATTSTATRALYEATTDTADPTLFTLGEHARGAQPNNVFLMNLLWLVVPFALGSILVVLTFVYRDPVDVVVGFLGIVVSLVWTFGLIGWLGIPAGLSVVIAPVLIIGLSVDYGLHVFMRYREERGAGEGLRAPMARSTTKLTSALALVTLTAVIGFGVNFVSSLSSIRQLALGIILGVVSAFVLSVTFVPAAKITVDSLLERLGMDRRKDPLGKSRLLEPVLTSGARLAQRAAPAVLIVGVVLGGLGGAAWADLDQKAGVETDVEIADWKKELPEPIGWTTSDLRKQGAYVQERYRAADADDRERSSLLIEPTGSGDAASAAVLDRVRAVHEQAPDQSVVFTRDDSTPVVSPVTVMQAVASEDESFAQQLQAADTDGDGVPERNVASLYEALFTTAPDRASRVIDRTDDGYASVRVIVPIEPDASRVAQGETMRTFASEVETSDSRVTAVGSASVDVVQADVIADAIVETMLLALVGVAALLMLVYRVVFDSASLGLATAIPIAIVTALVVGGMWLLDVPLTVNTALLLSIVIGLGIDYNIHVSDRAVQELERGASLPDALTAATTGTGGALLGSTLTTVTAFSAMLIAPVPFFQSFGTLVALALLASFVVSVFFLPSLVTLWHRHVTTEATVESQPAMSDD